MKSGVDKNIYKVYDFSDILWMDKRQPANYKPIFDWMKDICIKVQDVYYVRDLATESWTPRKSKQDAIIALKNTYLGQHMINGQYMTVGQAEIADYVSNYCVLLDGTVYLPLCDDFVIYQNRKLLNIDKYDYVQPNPNNIRHCTMMLQLIRNSLCDIKGELDLNAMLAILHAKKPDRKEQDFRFIMHWLAAIYKFPGINLQTNLWLIGAMNGAGKGTLVKLMGSLLGSHKGQYSESEVGGRGWNNFLEGKTLIECDEFDGKSDVSWNEIIKRETCNPELLITIRGIGTKTVPNIGNYVFTSNKIDNIIIDQSDRRNVFISTTNDELWREKAIAVNKHKDQHYAEVTTGFAAVLDSIEVDFSLLSIAYNTKLKNSIANSSKNSVVQWVESDNAFDRDTYISGKDLYDAFKQWFRENNPDKYCISNAVWGKKMSELVEQGQADTKRIGKDGVKSYLVKSVIDLKIDRTDLQAQSAVWLKAHDPNAVIVPVNDVDVDTNVITIAPMSKLERLRHKLKKAGLDDLAGDVELE